MVLRRGDIPSTAHSVTTRNTRHVILEEDAIGDLPSLVNLTISDVGQLEIRRDGMASHNQTRLRSVLFQNIQLLHAESHSFTGIWQTETAVRMQLIKELHVMSNAFSYQAIETGPSVSLQNVHRLNLQSNGFSATMFGMYLTNVNMSECQKESFGGNTYVTEWNNVAITDMHAKCFHSLKHVGSLNLNSVQIATIRRGAFSGDIRSLYVQNSHFGTVEKSGINMRVSNMDVYKSTIDELKSEGINMFAKEWFKMKTIRINHLRKNAFLGVKMGKDNVGISRILKLHRIEIIEAENGSLTFSDCNEVDLRDLDLTAPLPPICPTDRWTRSLSAGGAGGRLSKAQYQLFFQLLDRRWCSEDGWTEFPDSAERPSCQEENEWTPDSLEEDLDDDTAAGQTSQDTFSEDYSEEENYAAVVDHSAGESAEDENEDEAFWGRGYQQSISEKSKLPANAGSSDVADSASSAGSAGSASSASSAGSPSSAAGNHFDTMPNPSNKFLFTTASSGVKATVAAAGDRGTDHSLEEPGPTAGGETVEGSLNKLHDGGQSENVREENQGAVPDSASSDGTEHSSVDGELEDGHRMMLYVTLGAFLMLGIVLTVALAAIIIRKKPKRGQQYLANIHQEEAPLRVPNLGKADTKKLNVADVRGSTESVSSQLSQPHIYEEIDDKAPARVHHVYQWSSEYSRMCPQTPADFPPAPRYQNLKPLPQSYRYIGSNF
ncbi:uncharacterized protein LOC122368777 [Amphibalanus amphitrite]|uniref:uncharacterized protein LOC122368777 n=1 Tax=Amphibalanus amphitrite TaxID=1232801 RepID=UPI001C90DE8F|nr:uncharacterized protein LOC122368777 [Amphibalanus amphitrite]